MPRPPKKIRPVQMNLSLDEDVVARMQLELYSEVEGRIPHGAQSKFINTVLRKHFRSSDARRTELARRAKLAEGVPEAVERALGEGLKLSDIRPMEKTEFDHVWRDGNTGKFHFNDEAEQIDPTAYDTADEALVALGRYAVSLG